MRALITLLLVFPVAVTAANHRTAEPPRIVIIGTGDMADSLGPQLARRGYQVVYGSRSPASPAAAELVAVTGNSARVVSTAVAAQQAEVVALAVPWYGLEATLDELSSLDNKIVIDMIGVWKQGEDGYPERAVDGSSVELIRQRYPQARIVKTLATAGSNIIDAPDSLDGKVSMPLAADDRVAKEQVARLVAALGFDPVDFGPLRMAEHIESLQAVWLTPAFQRRSAGYEVYFRKSTWPCAWNLDAWSRPAADADALAVMPVRLPARNCD
jgi:predicted dinucleotide-binding enzyme